MTSSAEITATIFSSHIDAASAVSELREKCYKLASAYYNEQDEAKRKAAYALADKYQGVLEALNALDGAAGAIKTPDNLVDW